MADQAKWQQARKDYNVMSFEEQIKAAVAGGVGKAGIEALLGIKLEGDLLEVYEKAKAIKQLKKASG